MAIDPETRWDKPGGDEPDPKLLEEQRKKHEAVLSDFYSRYPQYAPGGSGGSGGSGTASGPGTGFGSTTPPASPDEGEDAGGESSGEQTPDVVPEDQPGEATGDEEAGLSDIAKRLLNISSEDVDYLRGEPYSTTQEQAMRARAQDRIRNTYDAARQRLIDTLGVQQGFSGVLSGALRRLSEAESAEMAGVDRDIFLKAADEMRSRLRESRDVVGGLERLERQRMLESLGVGQALDESERQRLLDLMAILGYAPSMAQAGQLSGQLLGYAGQLGQQAAQQAAGTWGGLSNLAQILYPMFK